MNKEQIEKAAEAYTQEVIESNTFDVNYEENNYDAGSLHATSEVAPTAFKAGAEWRINSVWHRPNEKPENDRLVLCVRGGGGFALISRPNNSQFCKYSYEFGFEYWAYVEDLLPNKE